MVVVTMSSDGNQFAIWRQNEDGLSFVDIYFYKDLHGESSKVPTPKYSLELTFGLVNIRAEFLNESLRPSDDFRFELEEEVLLELEEVSSELSLIVSRSNGANLLIFEPNKGNIVKEIDLTPKKVSESFKFCKMCVCIVRMN